MRQWEAFQRAKEEAPRRPIMNGTLAAVDQIEIWWGHRVNRINSHSHPSHWMLMIGQKMSLVLKFQSREIELATDDMSTRLTWRSIINRWEYYSIYLVWMDQISIVERQTFWLFSTSVWTAPKPEPRGVIGRQFRWLSSCSDGGEWVD